MFFNPVSAVGAFTSQCKAYCDTTVSCLTNTWTKAPLNQVVYDKNNEFNTTLNRFVVKDAGVYAVKGSAGFGDMVSGYRMQVAIKVSGVTLGFQQLCPIDSASPWTAHLSAVCEADLAVGDYIELFMFQSGAARDCYIAVASTFLAVHRVG